MKINNIMNKNDLMIKIKDNFKSLLKFSTELKQLEFSTFDLTDGTKITSPASILEIGSEIYALDDQNNQTPLEDGDYVLTDGRTITIKSNLIEAIEGELKEAEEEMKGKVECKVEKMDDMTDDLPTDETADEEMKVEAPDMEKRMSDIEKTVQDIMTMISKLSETQGSVNEQMMSKLESFSQEAGASAIRTTKKESVDYKKSSSSLRDELRDFQVNTKK